MQLFGHSAEREKRASLHLFHQTAAMHLHGGFGDADIAGNLFAEAAARDLNHDLALPGTERLESLSEGGQISFILPASTIASEADLDRIEKVLIAERFRQKLN